MQVTVIDTKYGTKSYDLNAMGKNSIVFGRQQDCDIIMQSSFVSRPHGVIFMENGNWYIQDMNSTYGMYWMDRKVDKVPVTDGTVIRIYAEGNSSGRYVEMRFSEAFAQQQQVAYGGGQGMAPQGYGGGQGMAPQGYDNVQGYDNNGTQGYEPEYNESAIESGGGSGKTVAIVLSIVVAALAIGVVLFFVLRKGTVAPDTKEGALEGFAKAMTNRSADDLLNVMFPEQIRKEYEKKMKANGYANVESAIDSLLLNGLGDSFECEFVKMSELKTFSKDEIQQFENSTLNTDPADIKIQDMVGVKATFRMKGQMGSNFTNDWTEEEMGMILYQVDDKWYVFPN